MTTNESPLIQSLWKKWLEGHDQNAADDLMNHYMYLVHFHVERIGSHLPPNVSKDDLKSFGMLGLFDALTKFQHKRELKFDTYASFRIRGAIIDGLRKEDWLPRSLREKAKKVEKTSQVLKQFYQREPTSDEIAKRMQLTVEDVEETVKHSVAANILSIEEKPDNDYKEGIGYTIPDRDTLQPDQSMMQSELKHELVSSMQFLNQNEQMVVSLFYKQELTLTEIGHVLELTTSRISQIHRKAIFKLRKSLQKMQANTKHEKQDN